MPYVESTQTDVLDLIIGGPTFTYLGLFGPGPGLEVELIHRRPILASLL